MDDGGGEGGESGEEDGNEDLEAGRKGRCEQSVASTRLCVGYNMTFRRGIGEVNGKEVGQGRLVH